MGHYPKILGSLTKGHGDSRFGGCIEFARPRNRNLWGEAHGLPGTCLLPFGWGRILPNAGGGGGACSSLGWRISCRGCMRDMFAGGPRLFARTGLEGIATSSLYPQPSSEEGFGRPSSSKGLTTSIRTKILGFGCPLFLTIVLFKNQLFPLGV